MNKSTIARSHLRPTAICPAVRVPSSWRTIIRCSGSSINIPRCGSPKKCRGPSGRNVTSLFNLITGWEIAGEAFMDEGLPLHGEQDCRKIKSGDKRIPPTKSFRLVRGIYVCLAYCFGHALWQCALAIRFGRVPVIRPCPRCG